MMVTVDCASADMICLLESEFALGVWFLVTIPLMFLEVISFLEDPAIAKPDWEVLYEIYESTRDSIGEFFHDIYTWIADLCMACYDSVMAFFVGAFDSFTQCFASALRAVVERLWCCPRRDNEDPMGVVERATEHALDAAGIEDGDIQLSATESVLETEIPEVETEEGGGPVNEGESGPKEQQQQHTQEDDDSQSAAEGSSGESEEETPRESEEEEGGGKKKKQEKVGMGPKAEGGPRPPHPAHGRHGPGPGAVVSKASGPHAL